MSEHEAHGDVLDVDRHCWRLDPVGSVDRSLGLSVEEIRSFDLEAFSEDFACVEGWVGEGLSWRGVRGRKLLHGAALGSVRLAFADRVSPGRGGKRSFRSGEYGRVWSSSER